MQYLKTFVKYNYHPIALISAGIINTSLIYHKFRIDGRVIHSAPYIHADGCEDIVGCECEDIGSKVRHEIGGDFVVDSWGSLLAGAVSIPFVLYDTITNRFEVENYYKK
jgi:hypothetical protein